MKFQYKLLYWILGLALVGVAISLYTYLYKEGIITAKFCSINSTFDCVAVNSSQYASIFGVPVALLGVVGYGFVVLAAFLKIRNTKDQGLTTFLLLAALGGLFFSLYLSSIEAFVLRAWCILCLGSQATMLALAILIAFLYRTEH